MRPLFSRQKVEYVKTLSRLISSSFYWHDKFFFFIQLGIYQKGENKCIVENTSPKKVFLQKNICIYTFIYIYIYVCVHIPVEFRWKIAMLRERERRGSTLDHPDAIDLRSSMDPWVWAIHRHPSERVLRYFILSPFIIIIFFFNTFSLFLFFFILSLGFVNTSSCKVLTNLILHLAESPK